MARPADPPRPGEAGGRVGSARPPQHRRWSFPIGRVLGIQIRVHTTFFAIVVLFWAASSAPGGMGPVNAMLWLAIVFACVTVHELSHSVVARSRGVGVRAIVLLPIGGVSELESMPDSPADELSISVVGPLASFALAGVAALTAALAGQPLLPVDLAGGPMLARIAWFNLLVGMFNLLPAFPLDGGRVLRALLEESSDRERATRAAARIGRGVAATMVAAGLFLNPWLLVIGVFVWFGATAEETATVLHFRLAGRRVRDVMVENPLVLDASEPVEHLVTLARASPQRDFPVVDQGAYAGLVNAYAYEDAPPGAVVSDIADADAPVLTPQMSLEDVLPLLRGAAGEAFAVVQAGRVVGLLRVDDLAHLARRKAA